MFKKVSSYFDFSKPSGKRASALPFEISPEPCTSKFRMFNPLRCAFCIGIVFSVKKLLCFGPG
jgi:hypothetical protein